MYLGPWTCKEWSQKCNGEGRDGWKNGRKCNEGLDMSEYKFSQMRSALLIPLFSFSIMENKAIIRHTGHKTGQRDSVESLYTHIYICPIPIENFVRFRNRSTRLRTGHLVPESDNDYCYATLNPKSKP